MATLSPPRGALAISRLRRRLQGVGVRRGAVRCGAVQCGTVQCGAVQCSAVRCIAVISWLALAGRRADLPTCSPQEGHLRWQGPSGGKHCVVQL